MFGNTLMLTNKTLL